jgi:hypothetical protein
MLILKEKIYFPASLRAAESRAAIHFFHSIKTIPPRHCERLKAAWQSSL